MQAILLLKYEQVEPLGAWFAERLAKRLRLPHKAVLLMRTRPRPEK